MNDVTTMTTSQADLPDPTANVELTTPSTEPAAPAIDLSAGSADAHGSASATAHQEVTEAEVAETVAASGSTHVATIGDAMSGKVTTEPVAEAVAGEPMEGAKKPRAPRAPKAAPKPPEGGSITAVVERAVRMTMLADVHAAALGRLFNISLPDDHIAKLTRLTGISLGQIGTSTAEALAIVLSLESANPIHVGVQLGRLPTTSLPDVYRCAHALTGATPPALPKGDSAVFAVADVLATLTADDFALARALSEALA